jgi:hypothetical protein
LNTAANKSVSNKFNQDLNHLDIQATESTKNVPFRASPSLARES